MEAAQYKSAIYLLLCCVRLQDGARREVSLLLKCPTVLLLRQSIFIYFISYNVFFFPGQNKKEEKKFA